MSSSLFFSASLQPSNNNPHHFSATNTTKINTYFKPNPSPPNPQNLNTNNISTVKMPTPPWMNTPILLPSNKVLDFSNPKPKRTTPLFDTSLTEKFKGGKRRQRQAMRDIIKSVTKLQEHSNVEQNTHPEFRSFESESVFGFPTKFELNRVLGAEEEEVVSVPWGVSDKSWLRMEKEKVLTKAEVILHASVLERLRNEGRKMKKWVKVNKVGVVKDVVDEVKRVWRDNELVMMKFDVPLSRNLSRAMEIVETQTGGLVVLKKKDTLVVYRGCDYDVTKKRSLRSPFIRAKPEVRLSSAVSPFESKDGSVSSCHNESNEVAGDGDGGVEVTRRTSTAEMFSLEPVNGTLYEREADRLLDGLGPRFINWWWRKPLPVDADLLPEVVPGFMTPFRLCPPHISPTLSDDELTYLRKSAPPLPTHFALGRNTKLQGLASAIIKLWEKSLIVKIAVKWGIPNTNNEQMAWELKRLTGGTVILRNKFFIILYRGKDFLSPTVANMVLDREKELKVCQLEEECARKTASDFLTVTEQTCLSNSTSGTFSEFYDIQTKFGFHKIEDSETDIRVLAEKERLEKELRTQEHKLFILTQKIRRSAKELHKLDSEWGPDEVAADQEMITEEERQCFRKVGIKMTKVLVLGRRGVFDGVIGNMHQHWKHREVVKVVSMQKTYSQVIKTASLLEVESGGISVAIQKLHKGHAIIIYRGKNYRRPLKLLPDNLLTKKEAFTRSLEMQRIGSLKFFANQRRHTISELEDKLRNLQRTERKVASKKYSYS